MNLEKTRMNSLENDCHSYEKRIKNLEQEVAHAEQDLNDTQDKLRVANEAIRNYQVRSEEYDKDIERLEAKVKLSAGEHDNKMAESSVNL